MIKYWALTMFQKLPMWQVYKLWTKQRPCFMSLYFIGEGNKPQYSFLIRDAKIPQLQVMVVWFGKNLWQWFGQGLGALRRFSVAGWKQLRSQGITLTDRSPTPWSYSGSWKWNPKETGSRSSFSQVWLVWGRACGWEEKRKRKVYKHQELHIVTNHQSWKTILEMISCNTPILETE